MHPGSGRSPLHKAAKQGDLAIIKILLAVPGIAINAQENKGYTPLDRAHSSGHAAAVRLLEKAGAKKGATQGDAEASEGGLDGKTVLTVLEQPLGKRVVYCAAGGAHTLALAEDGQDVRPRDPAERGLRR